MRFPKVEPTINDLLDNERAIIFDRLNCVKYGKIVSFDTATGSASVQIQAKKIVNQDTGALMDYPLLTNCPVFVAQGGGAYIEFPIVAGDDCMILFADMDLDIYWATGNVTQPNSFRTHDLSDGFVLVGFNKKIAPLSLSGKFRMYGGTHKVDLANATGALSSYIDSLFSTLISSVQTDGSTFNPGTITTLTSLRAQFAALLGAG